MTEKSAQYERLYHLQFADSLGHGKDGIVLKTAGDRAVKFLNDETLYRRELRAYQTLRQRDIEELNGFQIPRLTRSDDPLLAIEMTIVTAPFLLDFASAYTQAE